MSEELKPCPFCGSTNVCVFRKPWYQRWYATCNDCCGMTDDFKTNEDAINAWNHRLSPWHTGTPTEGGWYLTKVTDVDKPYEVLKFENGKWSDYLDYDDVPEVVNDSFVLAYQKIEPFKEDTV